ncbi:MULTISPECIES: hypothetical protein [Agrobacterium]|uniref:hypothetical protein n=1 Tax=Agrobacterium TaxID=357 RepID=UPI0009BB4903|nr:MULTISPECIES: hypothetical protein [Agrobacterium]QCL77394.1 hypothetical protein CFBP5499_28465 [Agrobacterium tumefaciens]CUX72358.1 conserved hypothetical protein [Agrobacterium sp. NCPPB 925]
MPKLKTAADVPQLVDALIDASPDIAAIGDDMFCVIDLDRPDANAKIEAILEEFGPRDHLLLDIVACLKNRGRFISLDRWPAEAGTIH